MNASTPILKAKPAKQWKVTTLRMLRSVTSTSDVANAIPHVNAK